MKRLFLSIFVTLTFFALSAAAQSLAAQAAFEKGRIEANGGKFETAFGNFKKALTFAATDETTDDFRAKIHFNIGVCHYRLNRHANAASEFEEALKLSKGEYEKAFYALGMAQAELQNWLAAEKAFLGALRLNERNGETWFDLAFVYIARKDYAAARGAFEKAVALKSVAASIGHNNLGVIFALGGDLAAAVREFETALKKSNGKFAVAERNLQFCKTLGQNFSSEMVAKLEFGNK